MQGVPVNEMHSKGFVSIGCEPCTIPILPNQHEREGRWAWEVWQSSEHEPVPTVIALTGVLLYCILLDMAASAHYHCDFFWTGV